MSNTKKDIKYSVIRLSQTVIWDKIMNFIHAKMFHIIHAIIYMFCTDKM